MFHRREKLPLHANGMRFTALGATGATLVERIYYSVGGGFVVDHAGAPADGSTPADQVEVPYPFNSGDELLRHANEHGMSISTLMLENEKAHASGGRGARAGLRDLARDGGVREARLRARGHPARRPQGQAARGGAASQAQERSGAARPIRS